jgi:hypothetical protein
MDFPGIPMTYGNKRRGYIHTHNYVKEQFMHETIKFDVTVRFEINLNVINAKRFDKKWRFSLISRYFLERQTVCCGSVWYGRNFRKNGLLTVLIIH